MFECGISVVFGQMTTQIENGIVTAVQRVGIDVDKERLEEVLIDARGNYERGFREGYEQAKSELIRCRDCYHKRTQHEDGDVTCNLDLKTHAGDWFCPNGKEAL